MTSVEVRISASDLDGGSEATGSNRVVYDGTVYYLQEFGYESTYVSSRGAVLVVYYDDFDPIGYDIGEAQDALSWERGGPTS